MKLKELCVIFLVTFSVQCQRQRRVQRCGRKSEIAISERIFDGDEVKRNAWPWLVAFVHKRFETFFCGGSLVSSKHVISAAHCFKNKLQVESQPPQYISAFVGKHNLSVTNELGSAEHSVWEIILHPDWDSEVVKFDADISVVVLRDSVKFSQSVVPICMPQSSNAEVLRTGTVVGWGKSERSEAIDEQFDVTPNELEVPAVNQSHCFFTVNELLFVASPRTFCAGFVNESKAPCTGDSGGGFYLRSSLTGNFELSGIVSASLRDTVTYRTCDIEVFSLYTNVAKFADWIKKIYRETKKTVWEEVKFDCKGDKFVKMDTLFYFNKNYSSAVCSHNYHGPMTRNLKFLPNFSNHKKIKNASEVDDLTLNFSPSTHIFDGIVEAFPNLKKLGVLGQSIKYVERQNFADMTQLETLDIRKNQIEFLPEDVFWDLPNLHVLFLMENLIEELHVRIFRNLNKLKKINFDDNKIENLPKDLFANNLELEVISAMGNPLKTIDVDFTKLTKLEQLNLLDAKCIYSHAWNKTEIQIAQLFINRNCKLPNP